MNESVHRLIADQSQEVLVEEVKIQVVPEPEEVAFYPEEVGMKPEVEDLKPFRESMRGAERRKEMVYGPETLKIESERDENEFECYNNSVFSTNFQLPVRKLCRHACRPLPLQDGTWILTEVVMSTGQPGCLSNHF